MMTLEKKLRLVLQQPVEDGFDHPGESLLQEVVTNAGHVNAITEIVLGHSNKHFSSSVLHLLARLDRPATPGWRKRLVSSALASTSTELREAAVQAAEHWGDEPLVLALVRHVEPVPWLRQYIEDVLEDYKEHLPSSLWTDGDGASLVLPRSGHPVDVTYEIGDIIL